MKFYLNCSSTKAAVWSVNGCKRCTGWCLHLQGPWLHAETDYCAYYPCVILFLLVLKFPPSSKNHANRWTVYFKLSPGSATITLSRIKWLLETSEWNVNPFICSWPKYTWCVDSYAMLLNKWNAEILRKIDWKVRCLLWNCTVWYRFAAGHTDTSHQSWALISGKHVFWVLHLPPTSQKCW